MDSQSERLGSLMAFSDLGLILSTYGVLLAFNYIVEPVSINTWIVCTFFVGIKILIVGIADITGIGKSVIVSMIFILVADAIIILINQLMAFGLSLRMLLIMTIVDLVVVMAAVLIWRSYAKRELGPEPGDEGGWIYSDEAFEAPVRTGGEQVSPSALNNLFEEDTMVNSSTQRQEALNNTGTSEIVDYTQINEGSTSPQAGTGVFSSYTGPTADVILDGGESDEFDFTGDLGDLFGNFDDEVPEGGQTFLSFEEITQELPDEQEIEDKLKETQETIPAEETFEAPHIVPEEKAFVSAWDTTEIEPQQEAAEPETEQAEESKIEEADIFTEETVPEPITETQAPVEEEIEPEPEEKITATGTIFETFQKARLEAQQKEKAEVEQPEEIIAEEEIQEENISAIESVLAGDEETTEPEVEEANIEEAVETAEAVEPEETVILETEEETAPAEPEIETPEQVKTLETEEEPVEVEAVAETAEEKAEAPEETLVTEKETEKVIGPQWVDVTSRPPRKKHSTGFTIPLGEVNAAAQTAELGNKGFSVPGFGETERVQSSVTLEKEVMEEKVKEPIGIIDETDFRDITGTLPQLGEEFRPLAIDAAQTDIDFGRKEARKESLRLNDQLNQLIEKYNNSLTAEQRGDYIRDVVDITEEDSVRTSDRIIRNKLKTIIDKQFVSEDVLHNLISVVNKISNRSYTLDVAEDNLREKKRLEAEREAEQKRREAEIRRLQEEEEIRQAKIEQQRKAAEERRRRQEAIHLEEQALKKRQEERAKQQAERERREQEAKTVAEAKAVTERETARETEKTTIKTKPVLKNNEVHLQNDDLDIIIDAADLELLKEFLKQQNQ